MDKINKEFWARQLQKTIDLNQPISEVSDKPTKLFDPIESAIEEIQNAMEVNECAAYYTDEMGISRESSELAIEALKKQIPVKIVDDHCPICGELEVIDEYCPNCGQKLDWSEEE